MTEITREKVQEIFFAKADRDFRLPVRWGGGDFYRELYFLLKDYRSRVENVLPDDEYKEYRDQIKDICQWVCLAISESFRGNPSKAYDAVAEALNFLTDEYPCFIREEQFRKFHLYRAVDVKDKAVHDRKRVFHVPFNLRSKISTARYSIPGYPALYLGTSLELNCAEIGKTPHDETVMAAQFKFKISQKNKETTLQQFIRSPYIIDLSVKPQDFRNEDKDSERFHLLTDKKDKKTEDSLIDKPEAYLLWYPLIAACSFIRVSREDPYSAEYVIPQLVMQWAKEMEMSAKQSPNIDEQVWHIERQALCGVCYFSCLSNKASEMGLNFAFPSSGSDIWTFEDIKNYCPVLATNFELTEPVFVSEYENVESCVKALNNSELKRIGNFRRDVIETDIKKNDGKYVIPDEEDVIPDYTFLYCSDLKEIIISNSITNIGVGAFEGCTNLTCLTIPNGVMSIGHGIVARCNNLRTITVDKGNKRYYDKTNCIIDRSTGTLISGCMNSIIRTDGSVTSIGEGAFEGCTGLTNLTIPDSVTSIGNGAFVGCTGLTNLTIPDSVTSIGDSAFWGCTGLTNLTIPDSVTSIGDWAFWGCTGLTNLTIPDSVTSIGNGAFVGCTGLKNLTIPDSVTSIGVWAFLDCRNLDIRVPNKFRNLNNLAFINCKSVTYYDP